MGKASRIKRRALKSSRRVRRGGGAYGYYAAVAAVCIVGVSLIAVSKATKSEAVEGPVANKDHWHAALGFYLCDSWLGPIPEFENRAGSEVRAGLHSHGDGLMHLHPFSGDEAGERTTLGRFLDFAGWDIDSEGFTDGTTGEEYSNGDSCVEEKAILRWTVNGEEQKSAPDRYRPQDQDTIGIYFVPADADLATIGEPPSKANLDNPNDIEPSDTTAVPGESTTTVAGATTTTVAGATTTTVAGATTTSAAAPTSTP